MTPQTQPHRATPAPTWLAGPWRAQSWLTPCWGLLVVLLAAGPIHVFQVPVWVCGLAALGVAGAAVLSVFDGQRYHIAIQVWIVGAIGGSAMWLAWTSWDRAWSDALRGWTIGTILVGWFMAELTWGTVRARQVAHDERHRALFTAPDPTLALPPVPPRDPQAVLWEGIFEQLGHSGIRFVHRRPGANGTIEVRLRLPSHGKLTFDNLREIARNIEVALSYQDTPVPQGAVALEQARDGNRRSSTDFLVHINTIDILAQVLPAPDDHTPRSVTEAFSFGTLQDGTRAPMTILEIHWMITALTRAGKTNLLHVIIYHLSRCYDAMILVADGKGGRTIRRWLGPFLDGAIYPGPPPLPRGRVADGIEAIHETLATLRGQPVLRPVIAWPAVDRHEFERQLRYLIEVAESRPYHTTGSKFVPSREHPWKILIIEEAPRFIGTHRGGSEVFDLQDLLVDACAIGAGEGVTIIQAQQRSTVSMAGKGDAIANMEGRICLGADDTQDARMVLRSPVTASIATALVHQGSFVMETRSDQVRALAGRVDFMGDGDDLDARCYEAALLHGNIVPGPKPGTLEYEIGVKWGLDTVWEDEERIGWVYGTHNGPWQGKPIAAPHDNDPTLSTVDTTPNDGFFVASAATERREAATDLDDMETRFRTAIGDDSWLAAMATEMDVAFGALTPTDTDPAADAGEVDKAKRLADIIDDAETNGLAPMELARELVVAGLVTQRSYRQMYRWLPIARAKYGVVQPAGERGRFYTARWVHKQAA